MFIVHECVFSAICVFNIAQMRIPCWGQIFVYNHVTRCKRAVQMACSKNILQTEKLMPLTLLARIVSINNLLTICTEIKINSSIYSPTSVSYFDYINLISHSYNCKSLPCNHQQLPCKL